MFGLKNKPRRNCNKHFSRFTLNLTFFLLLSPSLTSVAIPNRYRVHEISCDVGNSGKYCHHQRKEKTSSTNVTRSSRNFILLFPVIQEAREGTPNN